MLFSHFIALPEMIATAEYKKRKKPHGAQLGLSVILIDFDRYDCVRLNRSIYSLHFSCWQCSVSIIAFDNSRFSARLPEMHVLCIRVHPMSFISVPMDSAYATFCL